MDFDDIAIAVGAKTFRIELDNQETYWNAHIILDGERLTTFTDDDLAAVLRDALAHIADGILTLIKCGRLKLDSYQ